MTKTSNSYSYIKTSLIFSAIFSLRLIGIFMFLPIASFYAKEISQTNHAFIAGIALGICGLVQAVFQIPLGVISDRIGRSPVITFGLLMVILGSLICAYFNNAQALIIGRSLQGAGAIGPATLAGLADLTKEEQRDNAMAIIGIIIGFSFFISFLFSALVIKFLDFSAIFYSAALFSAIALIIHKAFLHERLRQVHIEKKSNKTFSYSLNNIINNKLMSCNISIMFLHWVFNAYFLFIPKTIKQVFAISSLDLWKIFLPVLVLSGIIMFLMLSKLGTRESVKKLKIVFSFCVASLFGSIFALEYFTNSPVIAFFALVWFFTAFNYIEAILPSLVTKIAKKQHKGLATGMYSTFQYVGLFLGGTTGGWLLSILVPKAVVLCSFIIIIIWLWMIYFSNIQYK